MKLIFILSVLFLVLWSNLGHYLVGLIVVQAGVNKEGYGLTLKKVSLIFDLFFMVSLLGWLVLLYILT